MVHLLFSQDDDQNICTGFDNKLASNGKQAISLIYELARYL